MQDRLLPGLAALQRGVDLPVVPLDHIELLVQQPHDLLLLGWAGSSNSAGLIDESTRAFVLRR